MLCRKPYVGFNGAYGCGQCMPCRTNKRRVWTHRIMLEALESSSASFFTLTYNQEHVPADGSVNVRDHQLFLKRLRKALPDRVIRFFGVGEYGDFTWRPHYHYALFNIGPEDAPVVARAWPYGFVYPGTLTHHSACYVASYVNKKMTGKNDERLCGRFPEFARMSLRPGLGAGIADEIASSLMGVPGARFDGEGVNGDAVPDVLRHGGKEFPVGRYIKRRVRARIGLPESQTQSEALEARHELSALREDYILATRDLPARSLTFPEYLSSLDQQAFMNSEARRKIWASKNGVGL